MSCNWCWPTVLQTTRPRWRPVTRHFVPPAQKKILMIQINRWPLSFLSASFLHQLATACLLPQWLPHHHQLFPPSPFFRFFLSLSWFSFIYIFNSHTHLFVCFLLFYFSSMLFFPLRNSNARVCVRNGYDTFAANFPSFRFFRSETWVTDGRNNQDSLKPKSKKKPVK